MSIKICGFCGRGFETTSPNQKFCSNECSRKYAGSITKSIDYAVIRQNIPKSRQENLTYGQYHDWANGTTSKSTPNSNTK